MPAVDRTKLSSSGPQGPAGGSARSQGATSLPGALVRFCSGWRSLLPNQSIATKLLIVLVASMVATFGGLGLMNMRLARRNVEANTFRSASRMSEVVVRSGSHYMLRDDRTALYEMMGTIASEPGVERLRIVKADGRISYSTDPEEVGKLIDKGHELCSGCHEDEAKLTLDKPRERFRIYNERNHRVLAVITPINNEPACSNAACHAHPAEQKVLGVLDAHMSLAEADANLASIHRRMFTYTFFAVVAILAMTWMVIWWLVHRPMRALQSGTERLAAGALGYQIDVATSDETGQLADSFNTMSQQLLEARNEITAWTRTLEGRVEEKTRELKRAHEQMMTVEKMLTIGEMAAVVAHEINNPLAGILTYAKLVKKWILRGFTTAEEKKEATECLDLIANESRRCGDLVKNLLMFSRRAPIHMESTDLNEITTRAVRLVQHKIDLQNVHVEVSLQKALPSAYCDGSQIEQVLLALIMNAIDAMPHGGNLWVSTTLLEHNEIELKVRDDGMGIPPELHTKIFEPFTTTKEVGKGVGLGCAISKGIVERHGGRIDLQSELGVGTTFRVILPLDSRVSEQAQSALAGAGA